MLVINENLIPSVDGNNYEDFICPWKKLYPNYRAELIWLEEFGVHAFKTVNGFQLLAHSKLENKPVYSDNKYALCVAC